ncbi:MAG: Asp-tRNA(Asn)/Glu-tRNA(Gln) amidotransferase subunit GatB [Lachnospiraceae bacterium]|jgi:aspartyl-tRNA(Asn)/glutamyl-tRNA(Gln) amidotransferase subunit B|nr:Asp-tRNA(Asn)/Glu-tRNA(Gln) amidotransferase subunit GatB [Lachnospiraceae bacterium]
MSKSYETVIGLEVHVELATKTKIFCACSTAFGGAPNTHTCPVCTGMPGSLPVLNRQVVEYALAVGLATNCGINQTCKFDRKNYFYPDNPQNYQISQLYLPICHDGFVEIETAQGGTKKVGIHEIHMEEDAGKLIHDEWEDCSLVDFNRSGVPLIEIVSEPDMRSADEVMAYLDKLRLIIQYLGASDCKLQEGSMRADVNLSVREVGAAKLGTRTEMKNLNSFKAIARAIEGERRRQIELLEEGKPVIQETRRWDDNKESSYAMRSKEDAQDYRYFPDPDLTPVVISDEWLEAVRSRQPELRTEKLERYKTQYAIPEYDALILTGSKALSDLFEETVALCQKPKEVSNWLMVEAMRLLKEAGKEADDLVVSGAAGGSSTAPAASAGEAGAGDGGGAAGGAGGGTGAAKAAPQTTNKDADKGDGSGMASGSGGGAAGGSGGGEMTGGAKRFKFSPAHLAKLIELVDRGAINRTVAKTVFEEVFASDVDPEAYVEAHGLGMVTDTGALLKTVDEVIAQNPQSVADYKGGKEKAFGFLVGQTMRAMKGKADPAAVNAMIKEALGKM